MSTGWAIRSPAPVGIFNVNPSYGTQRKDSTWELIALLTSPLTCYRLVFEKWVLLLSMVFGPERDARFFFYSYYISGFLSTFPVLMKGHRVNTLLHNIVSYILSLENATTTASKAFYVNCSVQGTVKCKR